MRILFGRHFFNFTPRFALALAVLFSFAVATRAQGQPDAPQAESAPPQVKSTPADGPVNLLMQLNLKPEQIEQMKEIRSQSAPEVAALMRRRNQARRALDEALYANTLDETLIEQRAREVAEAQAALVRMEAGTQLRVRRVLTTEQVQMFRGLRQQAQRRQRIERRLERRVNPQTNSHDAIERPLNQRPAAPADRTKEASPNPPAGQLRNSRPFAFPRARRRKP